MFRPTWVIFKLNTRKTLKDKYTLLSMNTVVSVYELLTLLCKVLKCLFKVLLKANADVVV